MTELTLLGRRIKIERCSGFEDCSKETIGMFDPRTSTVFILEGLDPEIAKHVLIHELVHSMFIFSGMSELFREKQEEAIATMMEGFLGLFKNRDFIEFIAS
jgi:hypothetical protein